MKRFSFLTFELLLIISTTGYVAFAQYSQRETGESFWDKYLPIAQLFDWPPFFWTVMGIAVVFFVWSITFIMFNKSKVKEIEAWGEKKSVEDLIELVDGTNAKDAHWAFVYLRNHGDEKTATLIVKRIESSKKVSQVNPNYIYLLEDLKASSSIPLLQTIAKGKSPTSVTAQGALHRLGIE